MGSVMDSRYWTCPVCCRSFDWDKQEKQIKAHDVEQCRKKRQKEWQKKHGIAAADKGKQG